MRLYEFTRLPEAAMNPRAFAQSLSVGSKKGVLIGFEFEVCVPKSEIKALKKSRKYPADWYDTIPRSSISHYVSVNNDQDVNDIKMMLRKWEVIQQIEPTKEWLKSLPDELQHSLSRQWEAKHPLAEKFSPEGIIRFTNFCYDYIDDHIDEPQRREYTQTLSDCHEISYAAFWKTKFGTTDLEELLDHPDLEWDLRALNTRFFPDESNNAALHVNYDYPGAVSVMYPILKQTFGKVKVYNAYHEDPKDSSSWYIEPDGSVTPNTGDGACEVVTPPMPVNDGIAALKKFYALSRSKNLYTGSHNNTGLHINVSIPDSLDVLKLAVFIGDTHILKQWGREDNQYVNSIIKSLSTDMKDSYYTPTGVNLSKKDSFDKILELATTISNEHEASVNFNGKYVSFRHVGGDYLNQQQSVLNIVGRFVRAMVIASDPKAYRQEYLTKLTKLIPEKQDYATVSFDIIRKAKISPLQAQIIGLYNLSDVGMPYLHNKSVIWNRVKLHTSPAAIQVANKLLDDAADDNVISSETYSLAAKSPLRGIAVNALDGRMDYIDPNIQESKIYDLNNIIGFTLSHSITVQPGSTAHNILIQQMIQKFKEIKD